jgi:hypothetical protein
MNKFMQHFEEELDDLNIQVNLPTDDLSEAFEQRKARFKAFIDEAKATVEEVGENEAAVKLKTHLEELQVQLALGRAEGKDAFEAQKKHIDQKLHEAQVAYEHWRDSKEHQSSDLDRAFQQRSEHFRTQLDLFKVQYHLGMAEAREEWDELQKDIQHKVQEMKQFWADRNRDGERRVDAFTTEMSDAYDHLKGAMKKLFS